MQYILDEQGMMYTLDGRPIINSHGFHMHISETQKGPGIGQALIVVLLIVLVVGAYFTVQRNGGDIVSQPIIATLQEITAGTPIITVPEINTPVVGSPTIMSTPVVTVPELPTLPATEPGHRRY
jgi:hypothetical protein